MLSELLSSKRTLLATSTVVPSPRGKHGQIHARQIQVHISRRCQLASLIAATACTLGEGAISAEYDRYAATYDNLDDGSPAALLGLPDLRRRLLAQASGRVLETAAGTGVLIANLHQHLARVDHRHRAVASQAFKLVAMQGSISRFMN